MTATVGATQAVQFAPAAATSRLAWGDHIRVFGTLAVIGQHVAHRTTLFAVPDLHSVNWWGIMAIEAACRWAVPLFVMLSGALLLDPSREEKTSEFYRKRFWRIGVPLVFWSLFYTLPRAVANGFDATVMADIGQRFAHGRPAYHLYFLFVIAGLYLLTPYLRIVIRSLSGAALRAVWVTLILLALVGGLPGIVPGYQGTVLTEFMPYVGYFVAGYELRRSRLSTWGVWIAAITVGVALAIMVVVTVPLVDQFGVNDRTRYLYDYFSPTVIVISVCLFLIIITAVDCTNGGMVGRWVALVAPATMGIFLMHPALDIGLQHAQRLGLVPAWEWTVVSVFLCTLVAFAACWMATHFCQRVPIVKSVVG